MAHPKLAAFVKTESWVVESGEYLTFPLNQSMPKGGSQHYLDFIEEVSILSTHVSVVVLVLKDLMIILYNKIHAYD